MNLKFALIYGGTDYQKQLDKIKTNVDVIIGTPGRIIDFYKQGALKLDNIQVSVMDEAGHSASISTYDVYQSNGVINVVDSVLMPK